MAFWDGTQWVPEDPRAVAPSGPRRGPRLRALTIAIAIVLLTVVSLGVAVVDAKGKPPGGGHTSGATLVVTPDPVAPNGATYTVTGSGYGANAMVGISLSTPGCCMAFNVLSDASGNIWFQAVTGSVGTYYVKSYRYGSTKLLATKSFTVGP